MFSDYELFKKMCKKYSICPSPEISEAIKIASETGELNLPCLSIVIPICEIIGRILTSSTKIKSVNLSDCMLVSQALSKIFDALCQGTNVTTLNLKGNNISGPIVMQLGDIFYHNNTLKYLHLEWNNLGSDVESFEHFCKGLCNNYSIEEVDLRYNQITSHCAEALSWVLKLNKSLKVLNLAWNTLGLEGGQLILNGIMGNKSIVKLNLRGNCVPDEILEGVDGCAFKNQRKKLENTSELANFKVDYHVIFKDKNDQSPVIVDANRVVIKRDGSTVITDKRTMENIDKLTDYENQVIFEESHQPNFYDAHSSSVEVLNDNLSLDKPGNRNISSRSLQTHLRNSNNNNDDDDGDVNHDRFDVSKLNKKINSLNKVLQERLAAVDILNDQIAGKNIEIDDAKRENNRLIEEMSSLEEKHSNVILNKSAEIMALKEAQKKCDESWKKTYKELEDENNEVMLKNKEWEAKVDRYEKEIRKNSLETMTLKEKLKHKSRHFEDVVLQTKAEILKVKQKCKEKENKHRVELNVLKNSLRETTYALEECQSQLLKTREELKETLINLSSIKEKCRDYETVSSKYNILKDCFNKLKEDKSLVEEKLVDAQRTLANFQRQVTALQGELIEPQRRNDLLKDELNQEKEKSTWLKQEVLEERSRLKNQDAELQKMNKQIMTLNRQINEIQIKHNEELKDHEMEIKMLKQGIADKERDFSNLKAEEAQRVSILYAAFNKYLNFTGPIAPVP